MRRVDTLPRLLSRAGYRTLQTGKHWEGDFANAGFDQGMTLAKPHPIEKDPAFAALGMKIGARQRRRRTDDRAEDPAAHL